VQPEHHLPLDSSDHSTAAAELAMRLAKSSGAEISGSQVYPVRPYDYRLKQMECTFPRG
jgi:nucleotide-binding universal stress UspA family protein